jgi:glycosyltransferase involved in cell wall biosynthesis
MKKVPLSVIVLTQNEEANLPGCLESLRFASQVVVVDCQSKDKTVVLARKMGADVHVRPWPGFTAQRNFALSKCRHKWVLSVDADERISPELAGEIRLLLGAEPPLDGYSIPEVNLYFGRWLRHGGVYPGAHLILFRRDRGSYASGSADVHEGVSLQRTGRLVGHLIHRAYPTIELALEKLNRYTSLEAKARAAKGEAGLGRMLASPLSRFFRNYFLKRGFMDGMQGFLYCSLTAAYSFLTQAKAWEIQRSHGKETAH